MFSLPCRLEKESKTLISKLTNNKSLRHETNVGQSLWAVGGEQHVCKQAQPLGDSDTSGSKF